MEILDIVNEHDIVLRQEKRNVFYKNQELRCSQKNYFRAIYVFIKNNIGEIWIPRRTADKKIFPSCLDASCAGHVEAGETYETAFKRELMEELHIDANNIDYKNIGKISPQQHDGPCFLQVYEILSNENPNYNQNDFCESYWIKPSDLIEKLEQKQDIAKGNLHTVIKHFYQR